MLPERTYPAKLLLLGEYSVVLGSEALALPFPEKGGRWSADSGTGPSILPFLDYLSREIDAAEKRFSTEELRRALADGWSFASDIPIGYGLGSSGALVAAVYDACRREVPADVGVLRSELAELESFFHGASSGMDPLVSYLNRGVQRGTDGSFRLLDESEVREQPGLFLVDTGIARETAPLVKRFMEWCEEPNYRARIEKELTPVVTAGITAYLVDDQEAFTSCWQQISQLQFELFHSMIPGDLQGAWERGLETGSYYLKLCGAGGGGYLLGLQAI